jgi:hypothetical protein
MRLQLLAARLAFAALVLAALTAAAAVAGVRGGIIPFVTGAQVMAGATALGLASLASSLVWLRAAIANNQGAGKRLGLAALVGSLALLYPPLKYVWYGYTLLPVHDASSDPDDPPQFVALAKVPSVNSRSFDGQSKIRYQGEDVPIAYAMHDKYQALTKPHAGLLLLPDKAFWRAKATAEQLGWTIVDASAKDLRIEATDKSFWFGRISDIVIRIRPAGTIGSRIDLRAESRDDARDHGRNIARIKAFFAHFRF